MPEVIRLDNLKSGVLKAHLYEPELNPVYSAFAQHYGFVPVPCLPRKPEHKGKVESGVGYTQENALKGLRFDSLEAQNAHLRVGQLPFYAPGVGKTHLAIAIGIAAIDKGYTVLYRNIFDLAEDLAEAQALGARKDFIKKLIKPNLLIVDEFGMRNLPSSAAEDLLEIFHRRYRLGANIIATNRPIEDWGKILGDNATTSAILDRFMDGMNLIKITNGRSYRVKSLNKNLDKTTEND